MVMKVGGDSPTGPIGGSDRASSRAGVSKAGSSGGTQATRAASDEFKASPSTVQLADREAPMDSARVSAISQAIREGRFSVDAAKVADRLIDGVRELTGQRAG